MPTTTPKSPRFPTAPGLLAATALSASALLTAPVSAQGAPAGPTYSLMLSDAITGDNVFTYGGQRYWPVDPGADIYQIDVYERPTIQTHEYINGQYAAEEYWENLDIVAARFGYDARYMYVSVHLNGLYRLDEGGNHLENLKYEYAFRFSTDPDGRYGYKFVGESPFDANSNPTQYGHLKTFGYRDTDGDVGGAATFGPTGLTVTKSDNPEEEHGLDGYDLAIVSDGRLQSSNQTILWQRVDPTDPTRVEFALDYVGLGLTQAYVAGILYFDCEANKGLQDPQNHLWNDKYTQSEAGSPNPGPFGLSEFGTQGTGNIYELDTLRIGPVTPPPTTPYCFADMGDCPCGNNDPNGGCINGSGAGAFITGSGSTSVVADDLVLTANALPPLTFGQFLMAKDVTRRPMLNSGGLLCIAPPAGEKIFRMMPGQVSAAGTFSEGPGIVAFAEAFNEQPIGQIDAGETWYFQFWFRDLGGPCQTLSGTSNAVGVLFTP